MYPDHEALFDAWKKNADTEAEPNFRFLRSLKVLPDPDAIDALAHDLHEEAFQRIDCTRCANCCKRSTPLVSAEDSVRIARHLGTSTEAFIEAYLEEDPQGAGKRMNVAPCPFLGSDDRCTIYEARPAMCRQFPHTEKVPFADRTYMHSANTRECPVVYYIVTRMRERLQER